MLNMTVRRAARGVTLTGLAAGIMAAGACSESTGLGGNASDKSPPTVEIAAGVSTVEQVAFQVHVKDNLGIKTIKVNVTGGITTARDTTFTSASTDATVPFNILVPGSLPIGTVVTITAYALDGALNKSATDTLFITVGSVAPADVRVTSPPPGTVVAIGKSVILSIRGRSGVKVRALGFRTSGSFVAADSTLIPVPLPDSAETVDTLAIPANAPTGPLQVTPFLIDSLGQTTNGPTTTLDVQPLTAINSVPVVNFTIASRVETTDTIRVEASDQAGISVMGYEVRTVPGGAVDAKDSVTSSGSFTSQIQKFRMSLPYTQFPTTVYVMAFARNTNGTRAYAKLNGSIDRVDTVTVVAGSTSPLPLGGIIADAVYHPGTDRIYMTNMDRNQVEVFNLADSSFRAPIQVGSRPWGISLWPRDHDGNVGDTLLVGNSGGTNVSYVNLNGGGSGREVLRYALPNIIAYTVTSTRQAVTNAIIQQRTMYDFSDRPQFVAATCQGSGGACGDVILTYSTTPTPGQSAPFSSNNGTLRWENLTQRTSHLFFEQAVGQEENRSDTLEVVRFDGNTGAPTVLVPYSAGVVIRLGDLGFRDTTFVRNSGDFRRALFGEAGNAQGSRVLTYDVNAGLNLATGYDSGVSPTTDVTDFIANAFARVHGVATNFDGSLNGIRADSTYLLNQTLRLQGILATTQSNAGLDFHPQNTGPNSFPLSSRLVFTASAESQIEIFDSYCYQRVAIVPIRDPVIGPLKSALRPSTGQIVLVGATARGVVIVSLPNTFTTSCL
jgi:hypothetical protein